MLTVKALELVPNILYKILFLVRFVTYLLCFYFIIVKPKDDIKDALHVPGWKEAILEEMRTLEKIKHGK